MALFFVEQDITTMKVDAIVNAANTGLQQGGGVCGAIFAAAGAAELTAECRQIGHCATGQAVLTSGCHLPARYVIHTPGPVWRGGFAKEEELLKGCYRNSLELAAKHDCASIAFPLISSGIYGYPKAEALRVAIDTIRTFLEKHEMTVYLVIFGRFSLVPGKNITGPLEEFLQENEAYLPKMAARGRQMNASYALREKPAATRDVKASKPRPVAGDIQASKQPVDGDETAKNWADSSVWDNGLSVLSMQKEAEQPGLAYEVLPPFQVPPLEKTFAQTVLEIIDARGLQDVEVYKRANLDRKVFSKLRTHSDYQPSRSTAISLALGLKLGVEEAYELLEKAGYTLSNASKADLIVKYFLTKGCYDIITLNETLLYYGEKPFGPA